MGPCFASCHVPIASVCVGGCCLNVPAVRCCSPSLAAQGSTVVLVSGGVESAALLGCVCTVGGVVKGGRVGNEVMGWVGGPGWVDGCMALVEVWCQRCSCTVLLHSRCLGCDRAPSSSHCSSRHPLPTRHACRSPMLSSYYRYHDHAQTLLPLFVDYGQKNVREEEKAQQVEGGGCIVVGCGAFVSVRD